MSREQNIAVQRRIFECVNAGTLEPLREVIAEDAVDYDPAPAQVPGPQGFIDFFADLRRAFPDARLQLDRMVADDDYVATAYTLIGTHEGPFRGVVGTGHRVEAHGVQLARFIDGRLIERWGKVDELGVLAQIAVA
jgi:steroid delta-isomerase-like uncharacterized protein